MSAQAPSLPAPTLVVTCAVIWRQGRILLAQRADSGLWELPGGKVKDGEELAAGLAREIREELGASVEVEDYYGAVEEPEPGRTLVLHAFVCRLAAGEPKALEHRGLAWATPEEMAAFNLCPADRRLAMLFARRPPLPPAPGET